MKRLSSFILFLLCSTLSFAQPGSGKCVELNGTSSYINCGTINLSGSQLTMQAWIKVDGFKTAFPYISSIMGTEATGSSALLRLGDASLANNKLQFVLYSGSSYMKLDGNAALSTNKWYHVAATFDGTTMKIYINGVQDASMSFNGSLASNDVFAIGRNYGNDRILDGQIDEVSVWNTALTQATIRDWMCQKVTSQHPDYSSLTGYWPINEGTGSSTTDASTNSYNGSLVGSSTWKNSGAPIGDESTHTYASTYSLGLAHPQGDSLHVAHTSGTTTGAHLYRVDAMAYDTAAPAPLLQLDTTHYWGVFVMGTSNYDVDYYYDGNELINTFNDCNIGFANRNDGSATAWSYLNLSGVDYTNEVVDFSGSGTKEFILGISSNGPHAFTSNNTEPLCNGGNDGVATVHTTGGVAPYTYAWANGSNDSTSTGLSAGYHVFTVTDANGCQSVDSIVMGQPSLIGASVNITDATCQLSNDGAISLTAVGGTPGYTYLWNDVNNSTTASITGIGAGMYTVTITDANGCTNTHDFEVESVGPNPTANLGSPDSNICEGTSFGLVPDVTNGPVTYLWSTGETGAIKVVDSPGTYTVTVTNAVGCFDIDSMTIYFVPPVPVNLGNNVTAVGSHTLDAGNEHSNFMWSNNATGQSIQVTTTGTYSVTATDSNGCESSDEVRVTIIPQGIHDVGGMEGWHVWPNPADDLLNIESTAGASMRCTITDLTGRVVLDDVQISAGLRTISIAQLERGTYIFTLLTSEGTASQPFVKR